MGETIARVRIAFEQVVDRQPGDDRDREGALSPHDALTTFVATPGVKAIAS